MTEGNLALGLNTNRRAAQQIISDQQTFIVVDKANQATQSAHRIVDGVVEDFAIARVIGQDAVLRRARDEVVAHDEAGAMHGAVTPAGVAQTNAGVAVNDDVALDDAILR